MTKIVVCILKEKSETETEKAFQLFQSCFS